MNKNSEFQSVFSGVQRPVQAAPKLPGADRPARPVMVMSESVREMAIPSANKNFLAEISVSGKKTAFLTERDVPLLRQVALARVIRLDDLTALIPRTDGKAGELAWRTQRDVVNRWRRMGAVSLERNPWGGNGLVVAQDGVRRVSGLPEFFPIGLPPIGVLRHSLEVSALAARASARDWEWVWEAELRLDSDGHRPDGLLRRTAEGLIPVEVELSLKERKRWLRIVREVVDRWGGVVYFCDPCITQRLTVWRDRDLADIKGVVSVYDLEAF